MKTIIAPNDRKDTILESLSREHHGVVQNIRVESLSAALKEESNDDEVLLLTLSSLLRKQKDMFPVYGDMFAYPAFLQEILSFAKECVLWNIREEDLPKDNPNEEELSRILSVAFTMDLAEKNNHDLLQKRMTEIPDDTLISWSFETDPYHYQILNTMKKKHPHEDYPDIQPLHAEVRYALSSRIEMESIAQYICRNNRTCNVILTDPRNQMPLLENVFGRYDIPYSAQNVSSSLHVTEIFYDLVMFGLKKDRDSLLNVLRVHGFSVRCPGSVYRYLEQVMTDISVPSHISGHIRDSLFHNEADHYSSLEENTDSFFCSIKEDYELILSSDTPVNILINAFSILRKSVYLKDQKELMAGNRIRQILISCMDLIHDEDDVRFLAECIRNLTSSFRIDQTDFCTVTDLTHPVEPKEDTFVVSVSGSQYPGFPVRKGLFDEGYVEKIRKYPSQASRYDAYMSQLSWISHSCRNHLIYSYYTNDYQGREVQLAFEIENTQKEKTIKWDPVELPPLRKKKHELKPETARVLFSDHGVITGSVSTIERWFACPYDYWISSGLKVRKGDTAALDAASIGTIQHSLLEHAVKEKGKNYTDLTREEIHSILKPSFQVLRNMHPNDQRLVEMSEERMTDGIQNALFFLKDFERDTSFVPAETEYRFLENITDHVRLRGTIDRLDTYGKDMLRIIDYKSSTHALSQPKVKAGAQLQLLSYLIIAQRLFQMSPAGAYYFSLKEEPYDDPAAKATSKQVTEFTFTKEDEEERVIHNRALKGWTFTDRKTELDSSENHISSMNTMYDYDAVEQCMTLLYDYFSSSLLNGNISLNPTEEACTFCDHKSVCRYHGQKRRTEPLVMKEEELKKGKEDG